MCVRRFVWRQRQSASIFIMMSQNVCCWCGGNASGWTQNHLIFSITATIFQQYLSIKSASNNLLVSKNCDKKKRLESSEKVCMCGGGGIMSCVRWALSESSHDGTSNTFYNHNHKHQIRRKYIFFSSESLLNHTLQSSSPTTQHHSHIILTIYNTSRGYFIR